MTDGTLSITSPSVMRVPDSNEFVMQLLNLNVASPNLMTTPAGVVVSNFLTLVAFSSRPFTNYTYTNQNNDFPLTVTQSTISSLDFLITDFEGDPLTYLPDFTSTLRFDVVDKATQVDPQISLLSQIRDYSRDSFVASMLGEKLMGSLLENDLFSKETLAQIYEQEVEPDVVQLVSEA